MAISTQAGVKAWRRVFNWAGGQSDFPAVIALQLKAFKSFLSQQGGLPDLEFVPFAALSSTDVVIADAACKVYAIVTTKATATASWFKLTDHATTGSDTAPEIGTKHAYIGTQIQLFPKGLAMANGVTLQGVTTADGGTGSSTDGMSGFVLIGAA